MLITGQQPHASLHAQLPVALSPPLLLATPMEAAATAPTALDPAAPAAPATSAGAGAPEADDDDDAAVGAAADADADDGGTADSPADNDDVAMAVNQQPARVVGGVCEPCIEIEVSSASDQKKNDTATPLWRGA